MSAHAAEGVRTDTWRLSPAEKAEAQSRVDAEAAEAAKKWAAAAEARDWTQPCTPLECYRFSPDLEANPRLKPDYVQGVLEDLGLAGDNVLPH